MYGSLNSHQVLPVLPCLMISLSLVGLLFLIAQTNENGRRLSCLFFEDRRKGEFSTKPSVVAETFGFLSNP